MKTRKNKPVLGITMGDPCGIGPELVLRLLRSRKARAAARFIVFGSAKILEKVGRALDLSLPPMQTKSPGEPLHDARHPLLIDTVPCPARLALYGKATAPGGRAAIAWIAQAIEEAKARRIDALVTAPINKEAVLKGGHKWPGHTEMLAEHTGAEKPVMMMVGGGLRAALVTTHVAMSRLPALITMKSVLQTIRITHRDLIRYFGLKQPRILVCGLNPHAGEAGRFGREEITAIAPAVRRARREGIACKGPLPADVVFTRRRMTQYDTAVAMYHDQANIPVKLLAFEEGVNVTLGLPIIRTSPDHGTAFDIVAKGVADPRSIIAAALMAARMAAHNRSAG